MKNIIYILLILSCCLSNKLEAQLLANLGQLIYSGDNAIIKVEGSILNDGSGTINHNGLIVIDSSFIQNNGTTQGFGEYQVFQNWDNSGTFIHDTSLVVLTGSIQNIQGTSVTDFYNLTLQGPGIKRQHINSEVSNILDLRANQLATDSFEMFVSNNNASAILYDNTYQAEGFVSSIDIGRLKRATNSTNEYIYPLGGSSFGVTRFRSISITPTTTNVNNYAAILVNNDASIDGFNLNQNDSSMCLLNNLFYHKVENTLGGDSATLKISYDLSQDGYWDAQATWNNIIWQSNNPNNINVLSNYSNVEKQNHLFGFSPIILTTLKPTLTNLVGDSAVCSSNAIANYIVNSSSNVSYNWTVNGGVVLNGQGTNSISVDWGNGSGGTVSVSSTNLISGCSSHIAIFSTVLFPSPTAGITSNFGSNVNTNDIVLLNDSSFGATLWNWDFDNGHFSTDQNTQTAYSSNGTFIIQLIVENQFGCFDTTMIEIVVGDEFIFPNVFTPNGDGTNDVFEILGYNGSYNLTILNRWGQTLFSGNENTTFWDGTTLSGEQTPEGTYFFVFNGEKDFLKKGTLTLLR